MPSDLDGLSPEERAKVLLGRISSSSGIAPSPPEPKKPQFDADLIPEVESFTPSAEDRRIDGIINNIDFGAAYIKFIGKMQPDPGRRRVEGIMISCPMPGHADSHPSAWYNADKRTWFCGGCQQGGDIYDLAAIHYGYDLNTYKTNGTFPVLRKQVAEAFGYTIVRGITGQEHIVASQPEPESQPEPQVQPEPQPQLPAPQPTMPAPPVSLVPPAPPTEPEQLPVPAEKNAPVFDIRSGIELEDVSDLYIPWQEIVAPGTFLWDWMEATTIDDLPHEFYFWHGLMALGFVAGSNNILLDYKPVKANFYVCLYGRSGVGKTRSIDPLKTLLEDVMPYRSNPTGLPSGVKQLPTPNSAEAMVDSFSHNILDPSTNQVLDQAQVKGLVKYDEFSALIARSVRQGSSIRETIMEMYDVHEGVVTTHSRSAGVRYAKAPFCQMISSTQPGAIHSFLNKADVETGFLNRWVIAAGRPRVDPIAYGGTNFDLTNATQQLRDLNVWCQFGHLMVLSDEALKKWVDFFSEKFYAVKTGRIDEDSMMSRTDLLLKKIMIAFAVNERKDHPTDDIVRRVCMLYPYLRLTYSFFSHDLLYTDQNDCQTKLIDIARELAEPPTKRDFQRRMHRKFDNETILKSLKNLVELGVFEEYTAIHGTKGRPSIKYKYVD